MRIDRRLSDRLKKINPSSTLAITSKAKRLKAEGKDVISLAAGEPDFDTPDFIKQAAVEALEAGFTKYTPTSGIAELKKAICEKFKRDNCLNYEPAQVVVGLGAKHCIFNLLTVLTGRHDEVIIPLPYWVSYPEMVNLCEATPSFIRTTAANNFRITARELKRQISSRTKVLILNSPSNPCGSVYRKEELEDIAKLCVEKKVFVISDEIYEKIIFDGLKHYSIGALGKEIYGLTITVNGLSKSHSMTGWRIGFLAAPPDIAEAVTRLQDHSTSNTVSIAQKAAVAALSAAEDFSRQMCAEFQKRRDYLMERLNGIAQLSYVKPEGAFYIFCNISKTGLDSNLFAGRLLEEALVAVIPGSGFGRDDFVRLSFATGREQLRQAMDRLEQWLGKL